MGKRVLSFFEEALNLVLHTLKRYSSVGVLVLSGDRILFVDKSFSEFLGYEPSEILRYGVEGIVLERDIDLVKRIIKGETKEVELRYKDKNGFVRHTINFVYDVNFRGKRSYLVVVVDISREKNLQMLYNIQIDLVKTSIHAVDDMDIFRGVCESVVKHTGIPLAVVGRVTNGEYSIFYAQGEEGAIELFKKARISLDDSTPFGRGTIGKAYKTKSIVVYDGVLTHPDAEPWRESYSKYNVATVCSIPILKHGEVAYILSMYSDILKLFSNPLRSLLDELRLDVTKSLDRIEANQKFFIFNEGFKQSMNFVVITDTDGRIIEANKTSQEISGYSIDELRGKKTSIFKSGYHTDEFYRNLWNTITRGKVFRAQFTNRKKDGSLFYLDSVIIPVRLRDKIKWFINVGKDVTLYLKTNARLRKVESFFRALYSLNKIAYLHEDTEKFIKQLPKIIVNELNFELAFIVEVRGAKKIKVKYKHASDDKYLSFVDFLEERIKIEPAFHTPPFFKSLENKKVYLENNIASKTKFKPFNEKANSLGLRSCFSLPLVIDKEVVGVLVGMSSQENLFDKEAYSLLKRMQSDISAHLNRMELKKWHDVILSALNKGFDFVVITDDKFRILYVNDNVCNVSGYSRDELIGRHHSIFSSRTHDKEFVKNFYSTLEAGRPFFGAITYSDKNSRLLKALMDITPYKSKDGRTYYIATGRDVTESLEIQKALSESLKRDPITGLVTRFEFLEGIIRYLQRAKREGFLGAVLVINPVRFSNVNIAFGFEIGNKLLKEIGKRIESNTREYDLVGRLYSDKFGVLIKDIRREEDVFNIVLKLLENISKPFNIDNETISLSFKTGVSLFPKDSKNAEDLLEKAEVALQDVKNKAESIGFYKEEFKNKAKHITKLRSEVQRALKRREFILHYQPYYDLKTGKIVGAEALIRWKKNGRIVPPLEFIPHLENIDMIDLIEDWVIEEVASKQKKWKDKGLNIVPISVNISPKNFSKVDFMGNFVAKVKSLDIESHMLNVEIIERMFIEDTDRAKYVLDSLRNEGFLISVDNFGTGYSALSYLTSIPITFLKIDISFVRKMVHDTKTKAVVKSIILLSRELSIKTIAEGVETEQQLQIIKEMGGDYVQGYYFSKPLPEEEFERKLE